VALLVTYHVTRIHQFRRKQKGVPFSVRIPPVEGIQVENVIVGGLGRWIMRRALLNKTCPMRGSPYLYAHAMIRARKVLEIHEPMIDLYHLKFSRGFLGNSLEWEFLALNENSTVPAPVLEIPLGEILAFIINQTIPRNILIDFL
jgi:hypothetical protein